MSSSFTPPLFMTRKRTVEHLESSTTANVRAQAAHGHDGDDDNVFTSANAPKRAPKRRTTSSATHELRMLREETALLHYQLDSLKLKWRHVGVDSDLLSRACDAVLAKREARRASAVNKQFKAQLLQHQLFFASMQSLMLSDCPLLQVLRAKDVFECLHQPLRLPAKDSKDAMKTNRKTALESHCATSLRLAPAVMSRFAHAHVSKASTSVPFSHTSIMGDAEFTYVASVFVCKLRNLSVEQVFHAAMAYSETLPLEFKRCLGIDMEEIEGDEGEESDDKELHKLSSFHRRHTQQQQLRYSRTRYCNKGSGVTSSQNSVFAAQLSEHRGVVFTDFVDQDDNDQENDADGDWKREVEISSAIVITAIQDEETGERQALLQRICVNRYTLPATSRKVHDDVKSTTAVLNGDLLMAVVCRELQSQVGH